GSGRIGGSTPWMEHQTLPLSLRSSPPHNLICSTVSIQVSFLPFSASFCIRGDSGPVVEKSVSNQKVASSIPCRSVLEQDTEPLIAPDVQCAISVNVKCVYIVSRTYVSRFG